jgi:hypothetical protein
MQNNAGSIEGCLQVERPLNIPAQWPKPVTSISTNELEIRPIPPEQRKCVCRDFTPAIPKSLDEPGNEG